MKEIFIQKPAIGYLPMVRVALSETDDPMRQSALENLNGVIQLDKQEVIVKDIDRRNWGLEKFPQFLIDSTRAGPGRSRSNEEFKGTIERYEKHNEIRMNTAEEIARKIVRSIQTDQFEGLHTATGILKQISDDARNEGTRGARDKDVLRKTWNDYRGVVHLGLALTICEEFPDGDQNVFRVAERIRKLLSGYGPRSHSRPYVDLDLQYKFIVCSPDPRVPDLQIGDCTGS